MPAVCHFFAYQALILVFVFLGSQRRGPPPCLFGGGTKKIRRGFAPLFILLSSHVPAFAPRPPALLCSIQYSCGWVGREVFFCPTPAQKKNYVIQPFQHFFFPGCCAGPVGRGACEEKKKKAASLHTPTKPKPFLSLFSRRNETKHLPPTFSLFLSLSLCRVVFNDDPHQSGAGSVGDHTGCCVPGAVVSSEGRRRGGKSSTGTSASSRGDASTAATARARDARRAH